MLNALSLNYKGITSEWDAMILKKGKGSKEKLFFYV
jgi:hypothetical protein